jgi:NADH-quinone oxidoreductase subunit N
MWMPDVYEGAPAPVTTYIATVSKGAMVALLLRFLHESGAGQDPALRVVVTVMAIASMLVGNLLAVLQDNIKRILAYSSIAHFGYLLVALLSGGDAGIGAATFYLVVYCVTTLAAFGVVTVLSNSERDADRLEDYRGLFQRRPALAVILMAALLSLAGIPLTAGFPGKFCLIAVGIEASLWVPVIVLILTSVIGMFYYLRIIAAMFAQPAGTEEDSTFATGAIGLSDRLVLAIMATLLVGLGVFPPPLLELIRAAIQGIG